jgi:hypothetical protein
MYVRLNSFCYWQILNALNDVTCPAEHLTLSDLRRAAFFTPRPTDTTYLSGRIDVIKLKVLC